MLKLLVYCELDKRRKLSELEKCDLNFRRFNGNFAVDLDFCFGIFFGELMNLHIFGSHLKFIRLPILSG